MRLIAKLPEGEINNVQILLKHNAFLFQGGTEVLLETKAIK